VECVLQRLAVSFPNGKIEPQCVHLPRAHFMSTTLHRPADEEKVVPCFTVFSKHANAMPAKVKRYVDMLCYPH